MSSGGTSTTVARNTSRAEALVMPGTVTRLNMAPIETIMDFIERRGPHIRAIHRARSRRLLLDQNFRVVVGDPPLELEYTKTGGFKDGLRQLISHALPYLDGLGLVVLKVRRDMKQWIAQHADRPVGERHNFFPVEVEPLRVERGQLIHIEYERSADAWRPKWLYKPRVEDEGYHYLVFEDPVWGAETLCPLERIVEDVRLPDHVQDMWLRGGGTATAIVTTQTGSSGRSQRVMTLWSPFWEAYRLARLIQEVEANQMHVDHHLAWTQDRYTVRVPRDIMTELVGPEARAAAPGGSATRAAQVEGVRAALDLYEMAIRAMTRQTGVSPEDMQDNERRRMARLYQRAGPDDDWKLTSPLVEPVPAPPPTSLVDLQALKQEYETVVLQLLAPGGGGGLEGGAAMAGGGGGGRSSSGGGSTTMATAGAVPPVPGGRSALGRGGRPSAVELQAEIAASQNAMKEERRRIGAFFSRVYLVTFGLTDLELLNEALAKMPDQIRSLVETTLRNRRLHRELRVAIIEVTEGARAAARAADPASDAVLPTLRQLIDERLMNKLPLDATLRFQMDEDDDAAEQMREFQQGAVDHLQPEQFASRMEMFDRSSELFKLGALEPETLRDQAKSQLGLDLKTLKRVPPPPEKGTQRPAKRAKKA